MSFFGSIGKKEKRKGGGPKNIKKKIKIPRKKKKPAQIDKDHTIQEKVHGMSSGEFENRHVD